jgi:hypothetical protein
MVYKRDHLPILKHEIPIEIVTAPNGIYYDTNQIVTAPNGILYGTKQFVTALNGVYYDTKQIDTAPNGILYDTNQIVTAPNRNIDASASWDQSSQAVSRSGHGNTANSEPSRTPVYSCRMIAHFCITVLQAIASANNGYSTNRCEDRI